MSDSAKHPSPASPPVPDAVALFSQGLDSILAVKVVQAQGIRIQAVKFITPFFGWEIKGEESAYCRRIAKLYDIELEIVDLSREYLELLAAPPNGYGKNFNPCVDCKILMFSRARELMEQCGARFLISGEVVGQRPFSQRRDTMNRIANLSGTRELLLRPLSAQLLPPSRAEKEGLIDRERLFDFSGRGRKPQMALAAELGIDDYPNPAGGCLLTDPGYGQRVRALYADGRIPSPTAVDLLKYGRFYDLGADGFVIVGRHQRDNQALQKIADDSCRRLHLAGMPGPVAILCGDPARLPDAAACLVRHSKAKNLPEVDVNWSCGRQHGTLLHRQSPAEPST